MNHSEIRKHIMGWITDEDTSADLVAVKSWTDHDVIGPLGGISSRWSGYFEDVGGDIRAFSVVVYADENIDRSLRKRLDQEEAESAAQTELREKLGLE